MISLESHQAPAAVVMSHGGHRPPGSQLGCSPVTGHRVLPNDDGESEAYTKSHTQGSAGGGVGGNGGREYRSSALVGQPPCATLSLPWLAITLLQLPPLPSQQAVPSNVTLLQLGLLPPCTHEIPQRSPSSQLMLMLLHASVASPQTSRKYSVPVCWK